MPVFVVRLTLSSYCRIYIRKEIKSRKIELNKITTLDAELQEIFSLEVQLKFGWLSSESNSLDQHYRKKNCFQSKFVELFHPYDLLLIFYTPG